MGAAACAAAADRVDLAAWVEPQMGERTLSSNEKVLRLFGVLNEDFYGECDQFASTERQIGYHSHDQSCCCKDYSIAGVYEVNTMRG